MASVQAAESNQSAGTAGMSVIYRTCAVTVKLRIQRWQCRNKACKRQTFASQLPEIAAPLARRTARAAELVHLFGHGVGGRPGERLLKRIGMPTSDDTILRHLKRRAKANRTGTIERSNMSLDCQDKSPNSEPLSSAPIFASPTSRARITRNISRHGCPS